MPRLHQAASLATIAVLSAIAASPAFVQVGPAKAQQIFASLPPSVRIPRLD